MQIRIKTGPHKGRIMAVVPGAPIILGRDAGCVLQIVDRGASREHAKIQRLGEMVFLYDMDSRNGSFVNGERVKEELLREGDVIRIGATQLVFESTRPGRDHEELEYEESDNYKSSLELNVNDLYVADAGTSERAPGHFRAVCRAAGLFQAERNEKVLMDRLLSLIMEFIPASNAYIFLRDETGALVPQAIRSAVSSHSAPISRSVLTKVVTESKAILTSDAMTDERFNSGDSVIKLNIRSLICVPVAGSGGVHGAIYAVNSSLSEAFDESDLQLVSALGAQLAQALDNLKETQQRRRIYFSVIGRLLSTLELMPIGLPGHGERVSAFCLSIASELAITERDVIRTALAGLLHDIGKIPSLAPEAAGEGVNYAELGAQVLKEIPDIAAVASGVRSQYENFDGSGFPEGLKGDAIPLAARIIAVASGFDKLLTPKNAAPGTGAASTGGPADGVAVREAFLNLEQYSGSMYDPTVVNALMVAYRHGRLGAVKAMIPAPAPDSVPEDETAPVDEPGDAVSPEAPTRRVTNPDKAPTKSIRVPRKEI